MKKAIATIIALAMMVFISGCGGEEKPSAEDIQGGDVTLYEDSLITGEESEGTTDKSEAPLPRGDWDFDVENGALFVDDEGNIVNREGDPVESFSYIKRIEGSNGLIDTSVNAILEGCYIDGDKVLHEVPPEVQYDENYGSDTTQQIPDSYIEVTIEDLNYDPYGYNGMAVQCTGEVWYSDAEGFTLVPDDWETSGDLPSVYVPGAFSPIPQDGDIVTVQGVFTVDEFGNRDINAYSAQIH